MNKESIKYYSIWKYDDIDSFETNRIMLLWHRLSVKFIDTKIGILNDIELYIKNRFSIKWEEPKYIYYLQNNINLDSLNLEEVEEKLARLGIFYNKLDDKFLKEYSKKILVHIIDSSNTVIKNKKVSLNKIWNIKLDTNWDIKESIKVLTKISKNTIYEDLFLKIITSNNNKDWTIKNTNLSVKFSKSWLVQRREEYNLLLEIMDYIKDGIYSIYKNNKIIFFLEKYKLWYIYKITESKNKSKNNDYIEEFITFNNKENISNILSNIEWMISKKIDINSMSKLESYIFDFSDISTKINYKWEFHLLTPFVKVNYSNKNIYNLSKEQKKGNKFKEIEEDIDRHWKYIIIPYEYKEKIINWIKNKEVINKVEKVLKKISYKPNKKLDEVGAYVYMYNNKYILLENNLIDILEEIWIKDNKIISKLLNSFRRASNLKWPFFYSRKNFNLWTGWKPNIFSNCIKKTKKVFNTLKFDLIKNEKSIRDIVLNMSDYEVKLRSILNNEFLSILDEYFVINFEELINSELIEKKWFTNSLYNKEEYNNILLYIKEQSKKF